MIHAIYKCNGAETVPEIANKIEETLTRTRFECSKMYGTFTALKNDIEAINENKEIKKKYKILVTFH